MGAHELDDRLPRPRGKGLVSRSTIQYGRNGRSLAFATQNIDTREIRAVIVGLTLVVKKSEPNSITVKADLDEEGVRIAQGILSAYERGPSSSEPIGTRLDLLS